MTKRKFDFEDAVRFHGHVCPGLAMGYRAAELAASELGLTDEMDVFAIVENKSCAVDAIQVVTGCTLGKGNLIVNDIGKQVYTVATRPTGEGLRIAVRWLPPAESPGGAEMWARFMKGDRADEVVEVVNSRKAEKVKAIFAAGPKELFEVTRLKVSPPAKAQVYPTKTCFLCGDKVMEPKASQTAEGNFICPSCSS